MLTLQPNCDSLQMDTVDPNLTRNLKENLPLTRTLNRTLALTQNHRCHPKEIADTWS